MESIIKAAQGIDLADFSSDVEGETVRIREGFESNLTGFLFFRAYKSEDFPEVTVDTAYFFIYSTDHEDPEKGKCAWGKGNDLNLSDFQEMGTIVSGYQAESPYLIRIPADECGDSEVLHFYYHTFKEPGYTVPQEDRLWTSSGGVLHENIWTDRGRPIPLNTSRGEDHGGYLKLYKRGFKDYVGMHLTKGGLPPEIRFVHTTDGRNFTQGTIYDIFKDAPADHQWKPQHGLFFDKYGQKWFIGTMEPTVDPDSTPDLYSIDRFLVLCKADRNFQITDHCETFLNGDQRRLFEATEEGDFINIYIQMPVNGVNHATYNARQLVNYL